MQAPMKTKPSNFIWHSRKSDRRIQKWWDETILGYRPQKSSLLLYQEKMAFYRMIVKHQVIYQAQDSKAEGVKEILVYI